MNLYCYLSCPPSQLLKTTHAGAILDLGEKRIVFDMMIPIKLSRRSRQKPPVVNHYTPKSPSKKKRKVESPVLVCMPRKVKVDVLLPVTKRGNVYKSENSTKVGTVVLDISYLFLDSADLYPDNVNLGTFQKQLLIEVCSKVKAYNIKKQAVSKECSLYHFPGTGGCTGSEIRTSEELEDLFRDLHRKSVKMRVFVLKEYDCLKSRN